MIFVFAGLIVMKWVEIEGSLDVESEGSLDVDTEGSLDVGNSMSLAHWIHVVIEVVVVEGVGWGAQGRNFLEGSGGVTVVTDLAGRTGLLC